MLKIGKAYITHEEDRSHLCADITIDGKKSVLWFVVDSSMEMSFCAGRADAFVMALLPAAMRGGHEIVCEEPVSARLHYQLTDYLIPALSGEESVYSSIQIKAPLVSEPYASRSSVSDSDSSPDSGAVGMAFSGDEDYFCKAARYSGECGYPLTHIAVLGIGDKGRRDRNIFRKNCSRAVHIADNLGLQTVFIDTNFCEVLGEKPAEVYSFREIACMLALQGFFRVYLFSSRGDMRSIKLEMADASSYDLLTINCASTESISFYPSGIRRKCEESSRSCIRIGRPYVRETPDGVRLCAAISWGEQSQTAWFEVKKEYGIYLTGDRADAFVAGILTTAMREDKDIVCEAPVTRRLLYQLNHYLVPAMSENMEEYHRITVYGEASDIVPECAGAVGTGWTGGVDSMFTFMSHFQAGRPGYDLTHLLIACNGAIEGEQPHDTLWRMVEKTERGFAAEAGIPVVGVDTNLQEIQQEIFIKVHAFRHAAVILALQRLFRVFLWSSSYKPSAFSFNADKDEYYELAVYSSFETGNLILYSAGGACARMQKIEKLCDYLAAYKYLHPCIYALRNNCGRCRKCVLTMVVLYGLGVLEKFSGVFDVKEFNRNKDWYFLQLLKTKTSTNSQDALSLLRQQGVDLSRAEQMLQMERCRQKIGIVTFSHAYDYGAFFQQYALQQYLLGCGFDADIVDYRSRVIMQQYRYSLNIFKKKGYWQKKNILYLFFKKHRNFKDRLRKQKKFRSCIRQELKMSMTWSDKNKDAFNEYYDFFIAGSDQIWNRHLTKGDSFYFLDFVKDGRKKKTYAPSFGSADFYEKDREFLEKNLKGFSHVLAREESGKRILDGLGIPADVVLDPVFLIEKAQWERFSEKSSKKLPDKYIFIYTAASQKTLFSAACEYAEKNQCEIILVTAGDTDIVIGGKIHNIIDIDVHDFLRYLRYAQAVFTTSFHGMALSVFLRVDFYYELNRGIDYGDNKPVNVSTRLENAARLFGVENREIIDGKLPEERIDWEETGRRTEKLRKDSQDKLKHSLRPA